MACFRQLDGLPATLADQGRPSIRTNRYARDGVCRRGALA